MTRFRAFPTALVAGLSLIGLAGCVQPDPEVPAEALSGSYARPHDVWAFHGSEVIKAEATDRLALSPTEEGLAFELELLSLGGHRCEVNGTALARGLSYRYSVPSGSCDLVFEPADQQLDGRLSVAAEDAACWRQMCPDFGEPAEGAFARN